MKINEKPLFFLGFFDIFWNSPVRCELRKIWWKSSKNPPEIHPKSTKSHPSEPKNAQKRPRNAQERPKSAQERPKRPQEAPKSPQEAPKIIGRMAACQLLEALGPRKGLKILENKAMLALSLKGYKAWIAQDLTRRGFGEFYFFRITTIILIVTV